MVAAFQATSQGVGLFGDVAHRSHGFSPEWPVTLTEGQECLYLLIPAGTALVISNQQCVNHPNREKEMYSTDKVQGQALEQDNDTRGV